VLDPLGLAATCAALQAHVHRAAPLERLLQSGRIPHIALDVLKPCAEPRPGAPESRASTRTKWPSSRSLDDTGRPSMPVAPTTNTRVVRDAGSGSGIGFQMMACMVPGPSEGQTS
jgi:hypothetical protein